MYSRVAHYITISEKGGFDERSNETLMSETLMNQDNLSTVVSVKSLTSPSKIDEPVQEREIAVGDNYSLWRIFYFLHRFWSEGNQLMQTLRRTASY